MDDGQKKVRKRNAYQILDGIEGTISLAIKGKGKTSLKGSRALHQSLVHQ